MSPHDEVRIALLALDGGPNGKRGFELYQATLTREVAPRLKRAQAALAAYVRESDACAARGREIDDALAERGQRADELARQMDAQVEAVWGALVEKLTEMIQEAA